MTLKCSVCNHPSRIEVDRLLLDGASRRDVARKFTLSEGAVSRHRSHIAQGTNAAPVAEGDGGPSEIAALKARAANVAARARAKGDLKAELAAERERRMALELELRLAQDDGREAVLTNHPAWQKFLRYLLETIGECARCRAAVLAGVPPGTRVPEIVHADTPKS